MSAAFLGCAIPEKWVGKHGKRGKLRDPPLMNWGEGSRETGKTNAHLNRVFFFRFFFSEDSLPNVSPVPLSFFLPFLIINGLHLAGDGSIGI